MFFTITTTHRPATDLGYLLGKNPARWHEKDLAFGKATVFYPEATEHRCTAALLLDVDPIGLSRGKKGRQTGGAPLEAYVNDRPYVASSFLSVAIAQVLSSAMKGTSKDRAKLADTAIPLEFVLQSVPSRGGEPFLRELFEPLGYDVQCQRLLVDPRFPSWGESRYFTLTLSQTQKLKDALTHLYVLIPVLDDNKHYWVGSDELDKLLRMGEGWLADHPCRDEIANRYLKRRRSLVAAALRQLTKDEDPELLENEDLAPKAEDALEKPLSLNERRLSTVVEVLVDEGASSVLDLGCGEGKLMRELLKEKRFSRIVGADVSVRSLEFASGKLRLESMSAKKRERVDLIQASATYRDDRFAGFDAISCVEVIEHLDPSRLGAFARVVFEYAHPEVVVVTTPNSEYNALFENLPAGRFRHRDHRFEWTRGEFDAWAQSVAARFGYEVSFVPIGDVDTVVGPPTQMAVFRVAPKDESPAPHALRSDGGDVNRDHTSDDKGPS